MTYEYSDLKGIKRETLLCNQSLCQIAIITKFISQHTRHLVVNHINVYRGSIYILSHFHMDIVRFCQFSFYLVQLQILGYS